MGSKTLFYQIETQKSREEVVAATKNALVMLGGTPQNRGDNNIFVLQANNGVNFAFTADFETMVSVQENKPGRFDLLVNVNWKPNAVFWVCLIVGFFIFGILWIIPFLYLFIDPSSAYQQLFFTVQNLLSK
jgi:hypothetical protein